METNPVLYVILNKELKMSAGKAASQAVHAAMLSVESFGGGFTNHYKRTVIVLEAKNSEQIRSLYEYLERAYVRSEYYIDEGVNEISPYSITALAVEPMGHDSDKREIFKPFPLFGKKKGWFA